VQFYQMNRNNHQVDYVDMSLLNMDES